MHYPIKSDLIKSAVGQNGMRISSQNSTCQIGKIRYVEESKTKEKLKGGAAMDHVPALRPPTEVVSASRFVWLMRTAVWLGF
jgi:hypothetical protein